MAKPHSWSLERGTTHNKMSKKLVVEGSDITSSQMMNFWRQISDGSITHTIMDRFLGGIDPFGGNMHFQVLRDGRWVNSEVSTEQHRQFWKQVMARKITSRHLQDLMEGRNPFPFFVDYAMTLERMLTGANFDFTHADITPRNFTVTGNGISPFDPKPFRFDYTISPKEAVKEMNKEGFRPARIEELVSYATVRPDEQRRHPIIGPGSVVSLNGDRFVPCLDGGDHGREIDLVSYTTEVSVGFRLLGVRR